MRLVPNTRTFRPVLEAQVGGDHGGAVLIALADGSFVGEDTGDVAVPGEPKASVISALRFDARLSRPSERISKSTDFSDKITGSKQQLRNPYCFGAVQSFGESGPRRDDFGLRHRRLGPELWPVNRADIGVSRGPARRRRNYDSGKLAEGQSLPSNLLRQICALSSVSGEQSPSLPRQRLRGVLILLARYSISLLV